MRGASRRGRGQRRGQGLPERGEAGRPCARRPRGSAVGGRPSPGRPGVVDGCASQLRRGRPAGPCPDEGDVDGHRPALAPRPRHCSMSVVANRSTKAAGFRQALAARSAGVASPGPGRCRASRRAAQAALQVLPAALLSRPGLRRARGRRQGPAEQLRRRRWGAGGGSCSAGPGAFRRAASTAR